MLWSDLRIHSFILTHIVLVEEEHIILQQELARLLSPNLCESHSSGRDRADSGEGVQLSN